MLDAEDGAWGEGFAQPLLDSCGRDFADVVGGVVAGQEDDDRLSLDRVGNADDGGFHDAVDLHQRFLDFTGADALAGDLHGVVRATEQEVVAILGAQRQVAVDPDAGDRAPVGIQVAFVVLPETRGHADEGGADRKFAGRADNRIAGRVDDVDRDPGGARVEAAGDDRLDHDAGKQGAGNLGAAGVVYQGTLAAPEVTLEPHEMFRGDGLAGGNQHLERGQIGVGRDLFMGGKAANERGGGPEMGGAVAFHQPRHARPVGIVGRAVIANEGGAAHQGRREDQGARDPAHVGGQHITSPGPMSK